MPQSSRSTGVRLELATPVPRSNGHGRRHSAGYPSWRRAQGRLVPPAGRPFHVCSLPEIPDSGPRRQTPAHPAWPRSDDACCCSWRHRRYRRDGRPPPALASASAGRDCRSRYRDGAPAGSCRSEPPAACRSLMRSPIVTGLMRSGCGLRRLLALFRSFSSSTSSGRRAISLGILLASSLVSRVGRCGDSIRRLAIDMSQRQAIGIDDTIATGDWLKSPWAREAALWHGCEDKLRRRRRSITDEPETMENLGHASPRVIWLPSRQVVYWLADARVSKRSSIRAENGCASSS